MNPDVANVSPLSPLIAVLEDRGIHQEAFLELQRIAKATVITAGDTIEKTIGLLRNHDLGTVYGLQWILKRLKDVGVGMGKESPRATYKMDNQFIRRLVDFAQTHVLAEIKHDARIPIQNAYQLVGCADEGPAYIADGDDPEDVYCLKEGEIFGMYWYCPSFRMVTRIRMQHVCNSQTQMNRSISRVGPWLRITRNSEPEKCPD